MRRMMAAAAMALVAGCFYGPDTQGRYDPRLYDAGGNVVTAAAPAPAPAPEAPPCREVRRAVTIGGQTQEAVSTACRQPDGTWRFVN